MEDVSSLTELGKIKGLKVAPVNIRSLANKINDLRIMLTNEDIDILCVSETWTHEYHESGLLDIDGYTLTMQHRDTRNE